MLFTFQVLPHLAMIKIIDMLKYRVSTLALMNEDSVNVNGNGNGNKKIDEFI